MLRRNSTVSPVSYLALLIVFLFSANVALGQTPQPPSEKPIEEAAAPAPVTTDSTAVAPATTVTPDETTATKTPVESPPKTETKTETKPETTVTPVAGPAPMQAQCKRNLKADIVALAQPIFLNRLGAVIPGGMVFALQRDTVGGLGKQLRADKRPRSKE